MTVPEPPPAAPPAAPSLASKIAAYRKTITSLIGVGLTYATAYYGGVAGDQKWISIAVAVASVLGVYAVPNAPKP